MAELLRPSTPRRPGPHWTNEGHAHGPPLEVRAMVRAEDLAKATALLEGFESAEVVPAEPSEPDPNDRSLQQLRARMQENESDD